MDELKKELTNLWNRLINLENVLNIKFGLQGHVNKLDEQATQIKSLLEETKVLRNLINNNWGEDKKTSTKLEERIAKLEKPKIEIKPEIKVELPKKIEIKNPFNWFRR